MQASQKNVGDLMISLDEYTVVDENTTLLEALIALDEAKVNIREGYHKHRAVLVKDKNGRLVGKVGHLAFLRALRETKENLDQNQLLLHAGVKEDMMERSKDIYQFLSSDLETLCARTRSVKVKQAMISFKDQLQVKDSLYEALKAFVKYDTLSLLVVEKGKAVGLLRLVDLFDEISSIMKQCAAGEER